MIGPSPYYYNECDLLFVRCGGKCLGNLSSKLKCVGARYGLNLPSATSYESSFFGVI